MSKQEVKSKKTKGFDAFKDKIRPLLSYFRYYPDRFIDFITNEESKFSLYFFQRLYLRVMMRYRKVFITATRGTSKSFLQNLAYVLTCIFYPGIDLFICAPGKQQAAKITQGNLEKIWDFIPELFQELDHPKCKTNNDYTRMVFLNGSTYDVVAMLDSERGGRRHGGAIEEIADEKFDADALNQIVIPLMAGNRLAANGSIDPNEVHKKETYITTAGSKQQFAYKKVKEVESDMFEMIDGEDKSAFVLFSGWELPCMHDLLDAKFVKEQENSPTVSRLGYLREYESIYTGSSDEALVSDENLAKARTVKLAEFEHCGDKNVIYVLAYDVARVEGIANALSSLVVFKLTPRPDGTYLKEIVNVFSMAGTHELKQAKFLKEQVRLFNASVLIIDANGLGHGVVGHLILDLEDGNPPYCVINDENKKYTPFEHPDGIPIVYALMSQSKETKDGVMNTHIMKTLKNINIQMLVDVYEGIEAYLKKYKIDRDKEPDRVAKIEMAYYNTTLLCDEIKNLKYKEAGKETRVLRISNKIGKDRFSAMKYGAYWIQLLEEKNKVIEKKKNWAGYITINRRGVGLKNAKKRKSIRR